VESRSDLEKIKNRWARSAAFFHPFEILFNKYTGHFLGTNYLLGEGLLQGIQTTLDGYVCGGQVQVMGVVDSIMFPNTIAFQRFEYPSSVPAPVQDRMADVARKVMPALGFDNGQFNIEFIYNPEANTVHIVEINPRMSSQFADLFEKVDGTNSYSVLLDLALGKTPHVKRGEGRHRAAFSCVLRTFRNQMVLKLPTQDELQGLQREFPAPSLALFVALQMLDVLTTIIGIRMGAGESSTFIARLMHVDPMAALLLAKLFAVALVSIALKMRRPRAVVFLNLWFVGIVTWNLAMIVIAGFRS